MKKYLIYCLVLISLTNVLFAQENSKPFYLNYNWESGKNIKPKKIDAPAILLKSKRVLDFYFDKKNNFHQYYTKHSIIQLNTDEEIENNNKIYIPVNVNEQIINPKARVIKPDGKIIELDSTKLYKTENEETGETYTYFAFEGIEKGSIIEYLYTIDEIPNYNGSSLAIQNEYPQFNVEFDIYAPTNLIFEFKSYNQLPEFTKDTTDTLTNHWFINLDSVPSLEKEELSPYKSSVMYFIFQLESNKANRNYDITSYGKLAKKYYENVYGEVSSSEKKILKKIIKESGANNQSTEEEKILVVENYLKTKIYVIDQNGEVFESIDQIYNNNVANYFGILRLYAQIFELLDIKTEIFFTSNRFDIKFDPEFESYRYLTKSFIYFPSIDKYMIPSDLGYRLGFIPYQYNNNYGLFLKPVQVNDFKSAVAKIKWIAAPDHTKTNDNFDIDVSFENELSGITIKLHKEITGYSAQSFQPYLDLIKEEEKDELYRGLIEFIGEHIDIKNYTVKNDKSADFPNNPFIIDAEVYSENYIDKAGDKYLFKVGELIGPQMEMYENKERKLPMELNYNHSYKRKITFKIPEGYNIDNLDKLNIDKSYDKDGKTIMLFKSYYKKENDKITVFIDEFYDIIDVPLELVETYRQVINAAADFNKVTLVLSKK